MRYLGSVVIALVAVRVGAQEPSPPPTETTVTAGRATPPRPIDEARAARGKAVFERYCISCHGDRGDGRGYSAQWLDPKPRDFTRGLFKCRSTPSGTLPTDDDLLRTLREGLYHTNMPSWANIGERNQRDVIEYVKTFSPRWKKEGPGVPVTIQPAPPDDEASRKRGEQVWKAQACFNCHGTQGKGDGPSVPTLFDDRGFRDVPFDFTSSPHRKCGTTATDLYRTFVTGMNGTPMPSFAETMTPEDAWHLVHYLETLQQK